MESKKYDNGVITINWQPKLCSHSKNCWHGQDSLPEVFKPAENHGFNLKMRQQNELLNK